MASVTDNTWVVDSAGAPVLLEKGDDVPAWAADQVGDHLLEGGSDAEPTPYEEQKIADLKAEVDRRNTERDPEGESYIRPEGRKQADLAAALRADDERADADAGGDSGAGG